MLGGGFLKVVEESTINPTEGINYFIDKSPFIRQLIKDRSNVSLIIRPRKLCKTVNLEMAREFLAPECLSLGKDFKPQFGDTNSAIFFRGGEMDGLKYNRLKIAEDEEFFKKHQGQHPVVFLSLEHLKIGSFDSFKESLGRAIEKAYSEHLPIAISKLCLELGEQRVEAILASKKLKLTDSGPHMKVYTALIMAVKQNNEITLEEPLLFFEKVINKELTEEQLEISLLILVEMVKEFYDNRKVYVFVDDHDAAIFKMIKELIFVHPNQRNQILEDIKQASNLITTMLGLLSKDKNTVEKMMITGSTALLNNYGSLKGMKVHTMASGPYNESFCFTQAQVKQLVRRMHKFRSKGSLENCYDGLFNLELNYAWDHKDYRFYDPWSVISYLEDCKQLKKGMADIRQYWDNTGSCCIFENVDSVDDQAYRKFGHFIAGSGESDGKIELSNVTLEALISMLPKERIIQDKLAYFVLEADGYIVTAETKQGKKGYRMATRTVGDKHKESFLRNWLTFVYLGGSRPRPSGAYATRTKDMPTKTKISSTAVLKNGEKTRNLSHKERNALQRATIRSQQLEGIFESVRSKLQFERDENQDSREDVKKQEKKSEMGSKEEKKESESQEKGEEREWLWRQ